MNEILERLLKIKNAPFPYLNGTLSPICAKMKKNEKVRDKETPKCGG